MSGKRTLVRRDLDLCERDHERLDQDGATVVLVDFKLVQPPLDHMQEEIDGRSVRTRPRAVVVIMPLDRNPASNFRLRPTDVEAQATLVIYSARESRTRLGCKLTPAGEIVGEKKVEHCDLPWLQRAPGFVYRVARIDCHAGD